MTNRNAMDPMGEQRLTALLEEVTRPTHGFLVLFIPLEGQGATSLQTLTKIQQDRVPELLRKAAADLESGRGHSTKPVQRPQ